MTARLLVALALLVGFTACEDAPEPTAPVPAAPADSVADSVNYQPAPGPIPDNTTLPDRPTQP